MSRALKPGDEVRLTHLNLECIGTVTKVTADHCVIELHYGNTAGFYVGRNMNSLTKLKG